MKNISLSTSENCIRCTFAVRGRTPILLKVDRKSQSISTIINICVNKFSLDKSIKYWLTLENGGIIEDVMDLFQDDHVIIEPFSSQYRPFPMFPQKKIKGKPIPPINSVDPQICNRYSFPSMPNFYPYSGYSMAYPAAPPLHSSYPFPSPNRLSFQPSLSTFDNQTENEESSRSFSYSKDENDVKHESNENTYSSNNDKYSFSKIGNERYYEQVCHIHQQLDNPINDDAKCSDIIKVLDSKFYNREEMISLVRHEAKKHGFNICIPRGDTILGDGTEQVTLYCDKYGLKRRRIQDCKERFSKKTNCKWKVKFQKRAGARYYELVKTPNNVHNHQLNQCLIGHAKFSKRRHDFDEFDKASRKRLNTTENPEITNFPDLTHQENDIILESSYLIDKVKNDQDSLKFKSNLKPIKEPCTISFNFQPKRIYHPTYFSPEANKAFQLNNRIPQHQSNYYDNQDIAKCENYNDIKNENAKFIEEDPKHLSQGSSLYSSNNSNQDACENVSDNQNPNEEDENEENLLDIKSMIDNEKLTFTQSDAIDGFKKVTIPKEFQCEMATQSLFDANDHWCVESTANQENENQYFYESNAKEDDSFNNLLHDFDNDSTNDLSHINYKR